MTTGRTPRVALPETRQLDVLAGLLERRGVDVIRCPLVAIRDSPDSAAVTAWIERFCAGGMNLCIFYTGEGIQRLLGFAERAGLRESFIEALRVTPLLTRGPKPARELRLLRVTPAFAAVEPTTDGVLKTLAGIDVTGNTAGLQLYGAEPLPRINAYLESRGASIDSVAPYIYASESDADAVRELLGQLGSGEIDAIAFTSKAQVERLARVAGELDIDLADTLYGVVIAAVGPIVAEDLEVLGLSVDVVPETDFFMKPMVSALMGKLQP